MVGLLMENVLNEREYTLYTPGLGSSGSRRPDTRWVLITTLFSSTAHTRCSDLEYTARRPEPELAGSSNSAGGGGGGAWSCTCEPRCGVTPAAAGPVIGPAGAATAPALSTNDGTDGVVPPGTASDVGVAVDVESEVVGSDVLVDTVDEPVVEAVDSTVVVDPLAGSVVDAGSVVVVVVEVVDSTVVGVVVSSAATGAPMSTSTKAATIAAHDPNVRGPVSTVIGATVVRIRGSLPGRSRTRANHRP